MSERADQHEGSLSDSNVKRQADRLNARARDVAENDTTFLEECEPFLRRLGGYVVPILMRDEDVSNGSRLAHFMGRRSLALQIVKEFEDHSPGFYQRMLAVREAYERDLRAHAQGEEK